MEIEFILSLVTAVVSGVSAYFAGQIKASYWRGKMDARVDGLEKELSRLAALEKEVKYIREDLIEIKTILRRKARK